MVAHWLCLAPALLLTGCVSALATPNASPEVQLGKRVAAANCGECHAIGAGRSRLADAPPFASLHLRYRAGGLDALLQEGMLAPDPRPEEGSVAMHLRMPSIAMDAGERRALAAYLHSLEPPQERP